MQMLVSGGLNITWYDKTTFQEYYLHALGVILSFLVSQCTIASCLSYGLTVAAPGVIGRIPGMIKKLA